MQQYPGANFKTIRVNAIGPGGVDAVIQRACLVKEPGRYCKTSYINKAKELG